MANMAALRTALVSKATWDLGADGLQASGARRMTIYMADHETHVSFQGAVDFLGLGRNGHIAFNEPGTPFDSRTRVVALSESTEADQFIAAE
mgnify:CR=1 FL=1